MSSLPLEENLIARYDATEFNGVTGNKMMNDLSGNGYHMEIVDDALIRNTNVNNNYFDFTGTNNKGIAKYVIDSNLSALPVGTNDNNDVTIILFSILNPLDPNNYRTLVRSIPVQLTTNPGEYHQVIINKNSNDLGMYHNRDGDFIDSGFNVNDIPDYLTEYNMMVFKLSTQSPYYQFRYNLNKIYYNITDNRAKFERGFSCIGGYHNNNNNPSDSSQYWGRVKRFLYYDGHLTDDQIDQVYNYYQSYIPFDPLTTLPNLPLADKIFARYDATDSRGTTGVMMNDLSGNQYNLTINSNALVEGSSSNDNYYDFEGSYGIAKYIVNETLTNLPVATEVTIIVFSTIKSSLSEIRALCRNYSNLGFSLQNIQILIDNGSYSNQNILGMVDRSPSNIFYSSGFNITSLPDYDSNFNMLVFKLATGSPYYQFRYNLDKTNYNITNYGAQLDQGFASIGGDHNRVITGNGGYHWGKIKKFIYYNTHLTDDEINQIYFTEKLYNSITISDIPTSNIKLSDIPPAFNMRTYIPVNGLQADTTGKTTGNGNYYNDDLTYFDNKSLTTTTTNQINESNGLSNESCSTRWSGYFVPSETANYQFKTESNDSSLVYIGPDNMKVYQFIRLLQTGDYENVNASPYLEVDNHGEHNTFSVISSEITLLKDSHYPIVIYYGNSDTRSEKMEFYHSRTSGSTYDFTDDLSDGQFVTNFNINKMSTYFNLSSTTAKTVIGNTGLSFSSFRNMGQLQPIITYFQPSVGTNLSITEDGTITGTVSGGSPGSIDIDIDTLLDYGSEYQKPLIYTLKTDMPSGFTLSGSTLTGSNITTAINDTTGRVVIGSNYLGITGEITFKFDINSS